MIIKQIKAKEREGSIICASMPVHMIEKQIGPLNSTEQHVTLSHVNMRYILPVEIGGLPDSLEPAL
jgi:hypothetical protein